jgi:CRP-like cAMP-binding protein
LKRGVCRITRDIVVRKSRRWPVSTKEWHVENTEEVEQHELRMLRAGMYFGENALLTGEVRRGYCCCCCCCAKVCHSPRVCCVAQPRFAHVRAETVVEVLALHCCHIEQLLYADTLSRLHSQQREYADASMVTSQVRVALWSLIGTAVPDGVTGAHRLPCGAT